MVLQESKNDKLNMEKFNSLPHPITARLYGGGEYWIEILDVQTGCMRIDVCGKSQLSHFSDVKELIDIDGGKHNPDDFWME
jgi:hypothetical protein